MTLTLGHVLRLPVLQAAEPVVVAAENRLDNRVRWLHVSEQDDVATYLSGGELLLTTGMLLSHDRTTQERFVSRLAEAGVAGVALRLGGALSEVPAAMVQRADEVGLPLVALQKRIAFSEAMEQVHRALVGEQAAVLRRAVELRIEFNDLVLQGSPPQEIVERLAELLDATVVVEDAAHRPLYVAGRELACPDAESWARHSRTGHEADDGLSLVRATRDEPPCAWLPLRVRDEPWGRLHVLRNGSHFDELDRAAVERAGAAVLLALMSDGPPVPGAASSGGALLSDLLDHGGAGLERFRRRVGSLGVDLDPASSVVAWALTVRAPEDAGEARRVAETAVRSALGVSGLFTGWYGESLVALVWAEDSQRMLRDLSVPHAVGVSEPVPIDSLREAVLQALEAARVAGGPEGPRVRRFGELGLDSLLMPSLDAPVLARYVEGELGPLLAHDTATNPAAEPLLPALEALLRANGRVARAAAELGVDRRTLAARVPALERLLDVDLNSFAARLRLAVALRAHRLTAEQDDGHPPH